MKKVFVRIVLGAVLLLGSGVVPAAAQQAVVQNNSGLNLPFVDLQLRSPQNNKEVALSLQILLLLTVIGLAPSILILTTSFLRIAIVLDFIKRALSLQQMPPNQVIMGISLFLTLFIMFPVFNNIYTKGFVPFSEGKIDTAEFFQEVEDPLRLFMFKQMAGNNHNDIKLFMKMSNLPKPKSLADVPTHVIIPAFVLHEMTVAFKIGILIFIPFIVVDMVVSSALMAMGMIMLPPVMISMPFKLMLFVLVDGWSLLVTQLVKSFG